MTAAGKKSIGGKMCCLDLKWQALKRREREWNETSRNDNDFSLLPAHSRGDDAGRRRGSQRNWYYSFKWEIRSSHSPHNAAI